MKPTIERRRRRVVGSLAGGALAAVAALSAFAATGAAAPAKQPENTSQPSIQGTAQVGHTLTARRGAWKGNPTRFAYNWMRCNQNGDDCNDISHANGKTYRVTSDDVGHKLRVRVTASNGDGSAHAVSDGTGVVGAGADAPTTSSQPRIFGTPREGQVLTAQPNSWNGTRPIHLGYHWQRCNSGGGDCGGTGVQSQRYLLHGIDVGHTLRVVVTATNRAGSNSATSDPTAVIQARGANPPPPPAANCASVSTVSLPNRLVVDRIESNPSQIRSRDQPLVARFHVVSTKGGCVSGALVYAVGVPFDRLSKAGEVGTDGNGWATITFRILPTFALRRGNLVVIFVRARKSGESLLAGVSTRRLVSVRVG